MISRCVADCSILIFHPKFTDPFVSRYTQISGTAAGLYNRVQEEQIFQLLVNRRAFSLPRSGEVELAQIGKIFRTEELKRGGGTEDDGYL